MTIGPTTVCARPVTIASEEKGADMSDHEALVPNRSNDGPQPSTSRRAVAYGVLAIVVLASAAAIQVVAMVVNSDLLRKLRLELD
jgi:hypothetical protein